MSFKIPLYDAPLPPPDYQAHLFNAYLAYKALTISAQVTSCCEDGIGFNTAIEYLPQNANCAYESQRRSEGFGHLVND